MQITKTSKPWHKYPLVWMMLFIPFSAVIMGVVMIWLAIDTDDGLVADDYYKQGLVINDVISLDKKSAELKLEAIIEFDNSAKVIKVQFDKGLLENYPETLQLSFQHATHANSDVVVTLNHGIDSQYIGYLKKAISEGIWYFEVSAKDNAGDDGSGWKLSARSHVQANNMIHLQSKYKSGE
ncbi:hypothetical protein MNBD_GAMMA06-2028 [hydrothermal vent metagenome]|uniref:Analog of CcoH, COG3198 n=1 Tax=hydrothermal vent metagenome TaxID=652676 RepID=A0A3B0WWP7_9ZZZZ